MNCPRDPQPWFTCIALLLFVGLGCGADGRFVVIGTARAPSTSGIIEVDDIDGGSTLVTVHLEHLHPPNRLAEDFKSYVVWFESEDGSALRAGELRYDPDARTGDLAETSPMTSFVVKVTAERAKTSSTPSDFVIATRKVSID